MTEEETIRERFERKFKATSAAEVENIRALFYGDSGVGKTRLVSSAHEVEEMQPVLMVEFDPGTMSIAKLYPEMPIVHVSTPVALRKLLKTLRKHPDLYRTVILDDLNAYYMIAIGQRVQTREGAETSGVPWMEDWLHTTFAIRGLLAGFKALPVHLLCTTLAVIQEDRVTGGLFRLPLMPGKLAWEVGRMFDIVGYLSTKARGQQIIRLLQVQPFRRIYGKDRTDALGRVVTDPTMKVIYEAAFTGKEPMQEEIEPEVGVEPD